MNDRPTLTKGLAERLRQITERQIENLDALRVACDKGDVDQVTLLAYQMKELIAQARAAMEDRMRVYPPDKKRLLFVADGPESIELYTSEEGAIIDFAKDCPALYLVATTAEAAVRLGPFHLRSIREGIEAALAKTFVLGGFGHEPPSSGGSDPGQADAQGATGQGEGGSAAAIGGQPAGEQTEASAEVAFCHCGQPLHYPSPESQRVVQALVDALGTHTPVTAGGRTWMVPRHYIALHGIRAEELPFLGFKESAHP